MFQWRFGLALAAACTFATGCDDGGDSGTSGDTDAAIGGGGGGSGGGGAGGEGGMAQATTETFIFTELSVTQPAGGAGTLLTNILQQSMDDKAIIILLQLDGWGGDGTLTIRGGAGQQTAGVDTAEDFSDDAFDWLTEGECRDPATDEISPCSVDVGSVAGTQEGSTFNSERTQLQIYAQDLAIIIPVKGLQLSGTVDGGDLNGELNGGITVADAAVTEFQVGGATLSLEAFLNNSGVAADVMLDDGTGTMVPGYALVADYVAEVVDYSGN